MITVENLTKRYGKTCAVDNLSFTIPTGEVTGFLGANGSGKSTTMRMITGLENPTSGSALINGLPFRKLAQPARDIGAMLNPTWIPGHLTGRGHLRMVANYAGVPLALADDALEAAGIAHAARRRVKGYSLGMRQRLGLASAMIGNPTYVLLDEPVNGLDPEGVTWMRNRIRDMAAEGRAVFVSSHLMAEMQITADRLVVIRQGKLVGEGPLNDFLGAGHIEVLCDRPGELAKAFVAKQQGDTVLIENSTQEEIGNKARELGLAIYGMETKRVSLEDAFLNATKVS
ncbi:ATP-binding cassette domain-containing protein [Corynebacterium breve]|uniref:ATP-binding cassette domain-containing protein n=1 Tax=Corynebacterium breve TaxID=3049799 RepID=A0ABY8VB13_9CORY|nr:ATP-binding cassette domain-containing protein [Corynebacterium breve]WIM66851.1 ATP-binding cassette domain-containing protein [Corynebacterium breve]